jgi:hypothetical protein
VLTEIKLNPWFTPLGASDVRGLSLGPVDAYPEQANTLARGIDLGTSGATQPIVPIGLLPPSGFIDSFPARILGSKELPDLDQGTPDDPIGAYQWQYTFQEVSKSKAGYSGWTPLAGGREGAAYNWVEEPNHHDGLLGNGVNTSNLSGTGLKPQPVTSNVIVRMFAVHVPAVPADDKANPPKPEVPAKTEYWFAYENGVDGSCDP